jgi:hypothetical protein
VAAKQWCSVKILHAIEDSGEQRDVLMADHRVALNGTPGRSDIIFVQVWSRYALKESFER